MSAHNDTTHRGTLVCVVLKAKNLPNKRSIGKQDPYCVLQLAAEQQKTQPDKRGGQHPTWDEQLHFEIYDDMEDSTKLDSWSKNGDGTAKASRKTPKVLKVSCYADDARDPELIGEGIVDLTDTLKTGEFDEWVSIKSKDRYAGEVYLELTFYSAAAPPKKNKHVAPTLSGTDTYGGAGTFSDDVDECLRPNRKTHPSIPSHIRPQNDSQSSEYSEFGKTGSAGRIPASQTHTNLHRVPQSQSLADIPSTLRPSSSLANLDAYNPPYAPPSLGRTASPTPPNASVYIDQQKFNQGHAHLRQETSTASISTSASMSGSWGPASSQAQIPSRYYMDPGSSSAPGRAHQSQSSVTYDPSDQLAQTMSTMTIKPDKPLPPPRDSSPRPTTPSAAAAGGGAPLVCAPPSSLPQSFIYHNPQHPGAYNAFQGALPMMNLPAPPTPQPSNDGSHNGPSTSSTPIPGSSSFHTLPPVPSGSSDGSCCVVAPVPSVINAQALYQSIAGLPSLASSAQIPATGDQQQQQPPPSSAYQVLRTPAPAPSGPPSHSASPAPRPLPATGPPQPQYAPPPPAQAHYMPPPPVAGAYPTHHMYAPPPPPTGTPGLPVASAPSAVYQPTYGRYYMPPPAPGAPLPPHGAHPYDPLGGTGAQPLPAGAYPHPAYHAAPPPTVPTGYTHYAQQPPPSQQQQSQQQQQGAPFQQPPLGVPGGLSSVPIYGQYAPAPYAMYQYPPPPQPQQQ
ncbi:hypothetical protein K437DRAFT_260196 [Tilletiaria anomala UBC 951]|uniref:C2 domain-containing protein n=1 Tax=Tilletiaria anomala (strain ATCC 24038 / CBS 436.72 / UBC 951) TaxID=1037660 RepID=A0A066V410_TILAU|nr:uncharacterized protein K437DRAFT_260196 [Tilletiaria anomala UBC 951]KDN36196.1 hypothetical protein K437DRAFT_260196 [Tilletiaria anomala UBC 951]